jgi:acetyltransferase-like isoleucine patch superfamily enzyme
VSDIDESARTVDSTVGDAEIREYVTVHDSRIGDDCRLYERCSVKRSRVGEAVDINAGTYVENAEVDSDVQIGPNCSVVGVTHELGERGMVFRDDVFERVVLHEGVFLGANAVVGPGVELGAGVVVATGATVTRDIEPRRVVLGTPPAQRVVDLADWLAGEYTGSSGRHD